VVEPEKPQAIIWIIRFACWVRKARLTYHMNTVTLPGTHTQAHARTHTDICNSYCFSVSTMVSWKRLNVTYIDWLISFINDGKIVWSGILLRVVGCCHLLINKETLLLIPYFLLWVKYYWVWWNARFQCLCFFGVSRYNSVAFPEHYQVFVGFPSN
jgi:hypothetical protein